MTKTAFFLAGLLFLFVVVILPSVSAEDITCAGCGKQITGQYIIAEGLHFHPEHFRCTTCGQRIDNSAYYYDNNSFYHVDCYNKERTLYCDYCGGELWGSYTIYEGKNYHTVCFRQHVATRCDLCGEIIVGKYYQDLYGYVYHAYHTNDAYHCEYCQGFFGHEQERGGFILEDGRKVCELCFENSIISHDSLLVLIDEVNNLMKKYRLDVPVDDIKFHLVNRSELMRLYHGSDVHTLGFTKYQKTSTMFGLVNTEDLDIYILYGVPRILAVKIVAHELNHAWQYLQNPEEKDPALCEGSCNFAAYLAMLEYDDPITDQMVANMFHLDDKYYGEGFLRVKKIVDLHGVDYWREYLADNRRFPDGY